MRFEVGPVVLPERLCDRRAIDLAPFVCTVLELPGICRDDLGGNLLTCLADRSPSMFVEPCQHLAQRGVVGEP